MQSILAHHPDARGSNDLVSKQVLRRIKNLARDVRDRYNITTPRLLKTHLRAIYIDQGIDLDLWPPPYLNSKPHKFKKLRGAYISDKYGQSVMINRYLPYDPFVFTMAHELKHHLKDQGLALACSDPTNKSEPIEIGAEVFAAELIYPEGDFIRDLLALGIDYGQCRPDGLVQLKHDTQTTLSYAGMAKRAERLGFAGQGALVNPKNHWKKLEEQIFGKPFYKYLHQKR